MVFFRLSSKGLQNVTEVPDTVFTFFIGEKNYQTTSFFAEFISPIIAKMRLSDSTFSSFSINGIDDPDETFQDILKLAKGYDIDVNINNVFPIREFGFILGNEEIKNFVKDCEEPLSVENAIQYLLQKNGRRLNFSNEIEFIARNFFRFQFNMLKNLDISLISFILDNPKLVIKDESSLFNIIMNFVHLDKTAVSLLEYVSFEFLPICDMKFFINEVNLLDINNCIWKKLCTRLITINRNALSISFNEGKPFEGIVDHLALKNQYHQITSDIINVFSSSTGGHSEPASVLRNDNHGGCWYSKNTPNQFITFDFNLRQVNPTHYTLKTYENEKNWNHLKNWCLEGSIDGNNFDIIDKRENDQFLNGMGFYHTYSCGSCKFYRYLRIRQIGPDHSGSNEIDLARVEFFGSMRIANNVDI